MAFVNEYASPEDVKIYDLDGINQRFGKDPALRYQWTIDRERNVFLIWMEAGREEFAARQTFLLWWQGISVFVRLLSATTGTLDSQVTSRWQLQQIDLSPELDAKRTEILETLKDSLVAYKVSGIGFPVPRHIAVFEF